MKALYIDCTMGAAGDMLSAALLELIDDKEAFIKKMNALNIPGVEVSYNTAVKYAMSGLQFNVSINGKNEEAHHHEHGHEHKHTSLHDIEHIVNALDVSEKVRKDILAVYTVIARAEGRAHGKTVNQIHFHEVGMMDAVADIAAFALLVEQLEVERIFASPVSLGFGHVHCAHGTLPVPAPATAYILQDVPVFAGNVKGEMCTPTGAALLKYFASEFRNMPMMTIKNIGCGMGKKDFGSLSCVRVMYGEIRDESNDEVVELSCNIDDMTGEAVGFAFEELLKEGALDVYTAPIQMKKSRPGILLSVMCIPEDKEKFIRLIFKHTTTIGIRESVSRRYTLSRKTHKMQTRYGRIREKISSGYGVERKKYEYEDLADIARSGDLGILDIEI